MFPRLKTIIYVIKPTITAVVIKGLLVPLSVILGMAQSAYRSISIHPAVVFPQHISRSIARCGDYE